MFNKYIMYFSVVCFLGLFITVNVYGQNANKVVTTNVTTISPAPVQQPQTVVTQPSTILPVQQVPVVTNTAQQSSTIPTTGNTAVDTMLGALITLVPFGYAFFKQRQTTTEISQGLNKSAQVQTQTVESMKSTDYTDEDIMKIFVATLDQLSKVGVVQQVLNEKMKSTPEDLLMNNKTVKEAAENLLTQIISDNLDYYRNLGSSPDDTCSNQYLRKLSLANKMTKK